MNIEEKVRFFFKRYPLSEDEKVLVGVSGGQDSVVLLSLLSKVLTPQRLGTFYFDHGLRKEAEEEKKFVQALSQKLSIPFYTAKSKQSSEKGKSQEEKARQARYRAARKIMDQKNFAFFATAHHALDVAVTVLMRLFSSADYSDFFPIQEKGVVAGTKVLRPLLQVRKKEIENYARRYQLSWKEDRSNADTRFLRNRIRLYVLPYLEKLLGKNIEKALLRTSLQVQEDIAFLEEAAEKAYLEVVREQKGEVEIGSSLLDLPPALKRRVLKKIWYFYFSRPFSSAAGEALLHLFTKEKGKKLLVGKIQIYKSHRNLICSLKKKSFKAS